MPQFGTGVKPYGLPQVRAPITSVLHGARLGITAFVDAGFNITDDIEVVGEFLFNRRETESQGFRIGRTYNQSVGSRLPLRVGVGVGLRALARSAGQGHQAGLAAAVGAGRRPASNQ